MWEGRLHRIGASAGITLIDEKNHVATDVMSQADIACYAAKRVGVDAYVYEPQQSQGHAARSQLTLDEQTHHYAQPNVDDRQRCGFPATCKNV